MSYLCFLIGFAIGLVVGIFGIIILRPKYSGILHIKKDGNEAYLFLDLDATPEKMSEEAYVYFKVHTDSQ